MPNKRWQRQSLNKGVNWWSKKLMAIDDFGFSTSARISGSGWDYFKNVQTKKKLQSQLISGR